MLMRKLFGNLRNFHFSIKMTQKISIFNEWSENSKQSSDFKLFEDTFQLPFHYSALDVVEQVLIECTRRDIYFELCLDPNSSSIFLVNVHTAY